MSARRILWCETYDDRTVGGSHTCMLNVVTRMDPRRFAITASFCRPNSFVPRYDAARIPTVMLPGPVHRQNTWFGRVASFVDRTRLGPAMKRVMSRRRIDLVVLNNSIFGAEGYITACQEAGVPVVVYERGIFPIYERHASAIALTSGLAASVAVSRAVRDHIAGGGFRSPRIEVVYDGLDPSAPLGAPPSTVRTKLGISADHVVIGMVGNVREWKGQHIFVEAFARLARSQPALQGLIVGACAPPDHAYRARITARIAELGLTDRLRLTGYRTDVADLLQAMDVVVHASTSPEPWGMVLLEAMNAARPVVATAMGGPLEILDEGRCGELVPPGDAEAMAHAIAKYLDDPGYCRDTVKRARARIESVFNIQQTVTHTSELFDSVVAPR